MYGTVTYRAQSDIVMLFSIIFLLSTIIDIINNLSIFLWIVYINHFIVIVQFWEPTIQNFEKEIKHWVKFWKILLLPSFPSFITICQTCGDIWQNTKKLKLEVKISLENIWKTVITFLFSKMRVMATYSAI